MQEVMSYMENPNLPSNEVKKVIIDYRTPHSVVKALHQYGIETLFTCKVDSLYNAIVGHSDLQIHHLGDKCFACTPEAVDFYGSLIADAQIIQGVHSLSSNYPEDIAYNIARIGKYAFHNLKYTDRSICEYYEQIGVKIINVKQGYTKCNMCIVNENAVITSDMSVARVLDNYGFDVLLISQGNIKLTDFPYGFIGGATGLIAPNKLAFAGNLYRHPECGGIIDFCAKHNVQAVSLADCELTDIGSIIPICELKVV